MSSGCLQDGESSAALGTMASLPTDIMTRRRGYSLLLVLSLCALLSACMAFVSMSVQWAYDSMLSEERRVNDRLALYALISDGQRWLANEVSAGHLPKSGNKPVPAKFSDVRIHVVENDGAVLSVYDLNYDPSGVPVRGWLRTQGTERFFPPGTNMFLLRAFKQRTEDTGSGTGIILEEVLRIISSDPAGHAWKIENRPVLWQEVWP